MKTTKEAIQLGRRLIESRISDLETSIALVNNISKHSPKERFEESCWFMSNVLAMPLSYFHCIDDSFTNFSFEVPNKLKDKFEHSIKFYNRILSFFDAIQEEFHSSQTVLQQKVDELYLLILIGNNYEFKNRISWMPIYKNFIIVARSGEDNRLGVNEAEKQQIREMIDKESFSEYSEMQQLLEIYMPHISEIQREANILQFKTDMEKTLDIASIRHRARGLKNKYQFSLPVKNEQIKNLLKKDIIPKIDQVNNAIVDVARASESNITTNFELAIIERKALFLVIELRMLLDNFDTQLNELLEKQKQAAVAKAASTNYLKPQKPAPAAKTTPPTIPKAASAYQYPEISEKTLKSSEENLKLLLQQQTLDEQQRKIKQENDVKLAEQIEQENKKLAMEKRDKKANSPRLMLPAFALSQETTTVESVSHKQEDDTDPGPQEMLLKLSRGNLKLLAEIFASDKIHVQYTDKQILNIFEELGAKIGRSRGSHRTVKFKNHFYQATIAVNDELPTPYVVAQPHGRRDNHKLLGCYIKKFKDFLTKSLGINAELIEKSLRLSISPDLRPPRIKDSI